MPAGVNWFVWRVLTHSRMRATLEEIEQYWSVEDLVDANLLVNTFDELDRIAALKARLER